MSVSPRNDMPSFPEGVERPEFLLKSSGRLVYGPKRPPKKFHAPSPWNFPHDEWWIVLECDHDLSALYRWFMKKMGKELLAPAWGTHISISRGEPPKNMDKWGFRSGERFSFHYEPIFHTNGKHWWMHVYSDEFGFIREGLGLSKTAHNNWRRFHLTVGKEYFPTPKKPVDTGA